MDPKAGLIIIGNEILSGRTIDQNVSFIAKRLGEKGIDLNEIRVIPDEDNPIIQTVLTFSHTYPYVITTGGIGATHDDITVASIAKAFGRELVENAQILQIMRDRGIPITPVYRKLALIPSGHDIRLIINPVTHIPSFSIRNVSVLAGMPDIMRGMFEDILMTWPSYPPIRSKALDLPIPENQIAVVLESIQNDFLHLRVGSYPYHRDGLCGTVIVVRGRDSGAIETALHQLKSHMALDWDHLNAEEYWQD